MYAEMPEHKSRVRITKRFISKALRRVKNPYLACSFGKDSSVMLHLVIEQKPDIPVRFATHPETNLLDDYNRVVDWWIERHGINLQEVYCEGGLKKEKHHQRDSLDAGDWDSFFVGIRAEESAGRRIYLRKHGLLYKLKMNDRWKICPMGWWEQKNVSAYLAKYELPVLDKYQFEGMNARTTAGLPRTHLNESLQSLKNRDPQSFNKLCKMFPDAKYYV